MKGQQNKEEIAMNQEEVRIMKIGTCPSLSGRSILTYHVGCNEDQSVCLRIYQNTGNGIFSKAWVALGQLDPLLASEENPLTSGVIRELFRGKSVNTTGFLIAALISEGLLKIDDEVKRTYKRIDPTEYVKGIQELIESDISLNPDAPPEKKKGKKETKKPKGEVHEE
jgi:hypothetical protein